MKDLEWENTQVVYKLRVSGNVILRLHAHREQSQAQGKIRTHSGDREDVSILNSLVVITITHVCGGGGGVVWAHI